MDTLKKTITTLPRNPGVYLFKDEKGTVLYVGKAIDLSRRVRQYFAPPERLNEKTRQLVRLIRSIETKSVSSEFDALLLEAKLIRQYLPKYNIVSRDDKSPIYIHISKKDRLPIVSLWRKPKDTDESDAWNFGPFRSGRITRTILRTVRHSIPFCMQNITKRPCFYTHLGLCSPCPSSIQNMAEGPEKSDSIKTYRHNIRKLVGVLSGKSDTVIRTMEKEMKSLSKEERFEEAGLVQKQQQHLKEIIQKKYEPFLYEDADSLTTSPGEAVERLYTILKPVFPEMKPLTRIETYDISNISGHYAVGSMVVLSGGIPDSRQYRKFRIRVMKTPHDPAMMAEMLERRLGHPEWQFPDLIVVDGGKPQLTYALPVISKVKPIPAVGLAKKREEIIVSSGGTFHTIRLSYDDPALLVLERIRDEAHRFGISYHRKLITDMFRRQKTVSMGQ